MVPMDEQLHQRAEKLVMDLERVGNFILGPLIVTTKTGRGGDFNKLQPKEVFLRHPIKERFPDLRGCIWGALSLHRPYRFAKEEAPKVGRYRA